MATKKGKQETRGRKTKLTERYLQVFEGVVTDVLFDDINAIIFTDNDLRELINDRLPEKEQISDTTWENWKSGDLDSRKDDRLKLFLALYKKALKAQQRELFQSLKHDEKAWQRWAWIIERKFSDWNLRNIGVNKNDTTLKVKVDYSDGSGDTDQT